MFYTVIVMLDNRPVPYGFSDNFDALDFYDAKRAEGFVFVYLFSCDGETYHPLDAEAVRKNLYKARVI